MKLISDIVNLIKEHTVPSGLFSFTNITIGTVGFTKIFLGILSVIPVVVGTIVGLITIYTWLEKRGLTKNWPKWLKVPDKTKEEE